MTGPFLPHGELIRRLAPNFREALFHVESLDRGFNDDVAALLSREPDGTVPSVIVTASITNGMAAALAALCPGDLVIVTGHAEQLDTSANLHGALTLIRKPDSVTAWRRALLNDTPVGLWNVGMV